MVLEEDGNAYGIFLLNSSALGMDGSFRGISTSFQRENGNGERAMIGC